MDFENINYFGRIFHKGGVISLPFTNYISVPIDLKHEQAEQKSLLQKVIFDHPPDPPSYGCPTPSRSYRLHNAGQLVTINKKCKGFHLWSEGFPHFGKFYRNN